MRVRFVLRTARRCVLVHGGGGWGVGGRGAQPEGKEGGGGARATLACLWQALYGAWPGPPAVAVRGITNTAVALTKQPAGSPPCPHTQTQPAHLLGACCGEAPRGRAVQTLACLAFAARARHALACRHPTSHTPHPTHTAPSSCKRAQPPGDPRALSGAAQHFVASSDGGARRVVVGARAAAPAAAAQGHRHTRVVAGLCVPGPSCGASCRQAPPCTDICTAVRRSSACHHVCFACASPTHPPPSRLLPTMPLYCCHGS